MADKSQRLIYRLEAENGKLVQKLAESESRFRRTDQAISGTVTNINSRLNGAAAGATRFGNAAANAGKGSSQFGRSAGMLGIQVSQLTGQIQGGGNAMLAFSQQAQDIGFVFGPGGALVGAIVSIAAALSLSFAPGLLEAKNSVKKLDKALESVEKRYTMNSNGVLVLTDRIRELSKVSKEAAEIELGIALIQSEIAITQATAQITSTIEDMSSSLIKASKRMEGMGTSGRSASLAFSRLRKDLGLTKDQALAFAAVSEKALKEPTTENVTEFYKLAKSLDLSNEKLQEFYTTVGTNLNVITQTKEGIEQLKSVMTDIPASLSTIDDGASTLTNREKIADESFRSLQQSLTKETESIEAEYADRQRIIENALKFGNATIDDANEQSLRSWEAYSNAMRNVELSRINELGSFFGQTAQLMKGGFGEQNTITKLAFAAHQAAAIPQMIASTHIGAAKALELGPYIGPALSAAIMGLGYASIGIVAGQTIASFEGGGFTGSGPRSGGMDGKGGHLAMLHPNEIVTDMTKGAGVNIQITNNVSNARPSATMDRNGVIRVVIDELGNQSSRMRSTLHQTSNVSPRGTR